MTSPAITAGAILMCPHGGRASIIGGTVRVLAGGAPIATIGDDFPVSGCADIERPCIRIEWLASATRVRIGGRPPALQDGTGVALCAEGSGGSAIVVSNQVRVMMR
ncbi:DUF4280 domain-containing protein [Sphingomonas colocasiae]|uniref:DUF4280 domain-containing protein n=1 Tax=Sphingomonas colocasiae TaxID=1848973 RepID=A0ABS7PJY8_9SPHN|nr:DUF4280 domain-containing protein [Sphingomonas colocasiae]MBY8821607.1 DUF4280 domain-containing protein [Sphingomonas colocasiae]